MKTLNEVIIALEYCLKHDQMGNCNGDCPYIHCCDPESVAIKKDALHYLNEYKRISAKLEKIALGNITETLEKLDNPALTWDELKGMEGKPVWVEYIKGGKCIDAEWIVIKKVKETYIENSSGRFQADSLGWSWQAFRKERK